MTSKKSLFVATVAGSFIAFTAGTSHARLFGHGSCGSSGGWGSGGSWGGSYGSGGSWGGSYGGSYGSCGSCGSYGGGYSYYGGYYDGGYASGRVISRSYVSSRLLQRPSLNRPLQLRPSLTLHVPADAKVTLAGVETKQSGETRQFATTRLASGQNWDGYKVVVEMRQERPEVARRANDQAHRWRGSGAVDQLR